LIGCVLNFVKAAFICSGLAELLFLAQVAIGCAYQDAGSGSSIGTLDMAVHFELGTLCDIDCAEFFENGIQSIGGFGIDIATRDELVLDLEHTDQSRDVGVVELLCVVRLEASQKGVAAADWQPTSIDQESEGI
jgi:hypothetical protein